MDKLLNTCLICNCRVIGSGDPLNNIMQHMSQSHGRLDQSIADDIVSVQPMTDQNECVNWSITKDDNKSST